MFALILTITAFIIGILFLQMKHPLAMGLTLLFQTITISLITGLSNKTFWYSYILYLVFLGGMLVLFIYVTSLASNEMFSLSMKLVVFSLASGFTCLVMLMINDTPINLLNTSSYETALLNKSMNHTPENTALLEQLYNYPNNFITILLIIYLLITLIAIVKITKAYFGPLRKMN